MDRDKTEVLEPSEFAKSLEGLTILCGELHDGDGFHLHLSNGKTLVIVGSFVFGLTKLEDITIQ